MTSADEEEKKNEAISESISINGRIFPDSHREPAVCP